VLNAWDPIGVYLSDPSVSLEWPEDEYDRLQWPLVSRLQEGASPLDVADFLRRELLDHFGVDAPIADDLLDQLFAWWGKVRSVR
jgi:hypothetical protein